MKPFLNVATGLLFTLVMSVLIATVFDLPVYIVVPTLLLLSACMPKQEGVMRSVVLEVWAAYIIERFYKDNAFLRFVFNDSAYVSQGRIVHIPQPGSKPNVVKNRTVFPATAVRRSDTDVLYALDEYTTDPTHIPNIDAIHLSYDMQDSVLGDHMAGLDETVADDLIIKWGANAAIVKTTGGPNATAVGPVGSQTGNRLGCHPKDLQKMMVRMNVDNVPKQDRYVLFDDNMYEFFYDSLGDTNAKDFSRYADAENGVVGKLHSFNIMTRSSVVNTSNADAVKALGAAGAATDDLGSLVWHKNAIAAAIGDTKLFQDKDSAIYYGDVHSALVMAGGRVRRGDGKGIYILKQGKPA